MIFPDYLKSREDRESLPTRTEMESSESALVRLIGVYHLNSTQFVKGILASKSFDEIQSDRRLTSKKFINKKTTC